mgnify:CR=1 FL=1
MGRVYDNQILDMIEFGVKRYKSLQEFKNEKVNIMCKPCLVFNGDQWAKSDELRHIKSLLTDMFHVEDVRNLLLLLMSNYYTNKLFHSRLKPLDFKELNMSLALHSQRTLQS